MNFTLHKYCYGACDNRAYAAARIYAEIYPGRRHPDSKMRMNGNVLPITAFGRVLTAHSPDTKTRRDSSGMDVANPRV